MWSGALALLLAACASNPQQLPVDVSACRAGGTGQPGVIANIHSKAYRPISRLDMAITFYQDFRYRSFTGFAKLAQELDPGDKRDVRFEVAGGATPALRGEAMRCFVTRIGYLDGTWEAAPRNQ
jgi:hypothetical protein